MSVNISRLLEETNHMYYKLLIVLGIPFSGKSKLLKEINQFPGTEYLNLGLLLSEKLLNHSTNHQKQIIDKLIQEIINPLKDIILVFDNIELLFDPNLNLNVLAIFKQISRHQPCVVAWTGRIFNNKLRFGELGYWGYQSYDLGEIKVVNLNGECNEV